jgi:hypothetical protein
MNDDLLTMFRAEVPLPNEATARRVLERATQSRHGRVRRRRLAVAALVAAAGVAGALFATLGGASPSRSLAARQKIVDAAVSQVRRAFGDRRIVKANLTGSLLTVAITTGGPVGDSVSPFESLVLGYVADRELRAAGDEGVQTVTTRNPDGTVSPGVGGDETLAPLPAANRLGDGACAVPAGVKLANVTAATGRLVPLLDGFCAIRLTTNHPATFASDVEATLDQLFAAVPAARISLGRPALVEAYDAKGTPVIIGAWSDNGGSVYVRPGLCTPIVDSLSTVCDSGPAHG